jgi:hypothetical protein
LGGIVVELHAEGEHKVVEILMLRGEVEAEDVAGGFDGIGSFLRLDGDIAEDADLGGVGGVGYLAGSIGHGNRGEDDCGGMAVDGVVSRLLGDGGLAVLLELTENLLVNEGLELNGATEDVRAGVVDGREDEGRGVDWGDGVGKEGGVGTLRCGGRCVRFRGAGGGWCGGRLGGAGGVCDEAARIEVGDVQNRVVKAPGQVWIGWGGRLFGSLGESRCTDEEREKEGRRTKHHLLIVAPGRASVQRAEAAGARHCGNGLPDFSPSLTRISVGLRALSFLRTSLRRKGKWRWRLNRVC